MVVDDGDPQVLVHHPTPAGSLTWVGAVGEQAPQLDVPSQFGRSFAHRRQPDTGRHRVTDADPSSTTSMSTVPLVVAVTAVVNQQRSAPAWRTTFVTASVTMRYRHFDRCGKLRQVGWQIEADVEVLVELASELGDGTEQAELIEHGRAEVAHDLLELHDDVVDLVGEGGRACRALDLFDAWERRGRDGARMCAVPARCPSGSDRCRRGGRGAVVAALPLEPRRWPRSTDGAQWPAASSVRRGSNGPVRLSGPARPTCAATARAPSRRRAGRRPRRDGGATRPGGAWPGPPRTRHAATRQARRRSQRRRARSSRIRSWAGGTSRSSLPEPTWSTTRCTRARGSSRDP